MTTRRQPWDFDPFAFTGNVRAHPTFPQPTNSGGKNTLRQWKRFMIQCGEPLKGMRNLKKWFVIQTKASQEVRAAVGVTQQGFPTFVPLRTEFKREGKRLLPVAKPLFERYIFAVIDVKKPGWGPISNTRGVSRILCNVDGIPVPVPNRVMRELRERDKKREKKPRRVKNRFEIGDRVRFHAGLWSGSTGFVIGYARGGVSVLTGPLAVIASEDDLTRISRENEKVNDARFSRRAA